MIHEPIPELEPQTEQVEQRRSILIVDDDQAQTYTLSLRLQTQGFETVSAHTGHQALDIARDAGPDLILLDLGLPDMDGLEVCQKLADAPESCGIPVIILSGQERQDIIRNSRAAGCLFFMRKPYDPNALLTLIEHSLDDALDQW